MQNRDVESLIASIANKVANKVANGELCFKKQGLATQSEKAIFDVLQELRSEGAIVCQEVIYDEASHQFPDIVIRFDEEYALGVEVKSSSSNNNSWAINGNSVLGSTSVSVNDMYIIFIKFNNNGFDIKYGRYEECITDVVVTHSPRYKIDLNAKPSNTFFNRSGISYEQMKLSDNPIALITAYFRKEGKTAWWLGDSTDENSTSATILSWSDVDTLLKSQIYGQAFVLFPEIINGSPRYKYNRLAKWLVAKYSIADSSLRDKFSAGGKVSLTLHDIQLNDVAQVFQTLTDNAISLNKAFAELDIIELQEFWSDYNPTHDSVHSRKLYWHAKVTTDVTSTEQQKFIQALLKIDIP